MSLERAVFAPVERLACTLYPRRARIALVAGLLVVIPVLVLLAAQLTWPWPPFALGIARLAPPVGFSASFTCFAALLLAGWFCPSSRWFMHAPNRPSRFLNFCLVLARSWALIVLCAMAASPLFVLIAGVLLHS